MARAALDGVLDPDRMLTTVVEPPPQCERLNCRQEQVVSIATEDALRSSAAELPHGAGAQTRRSARLGLAVGIASFCAYMIGAGRSYGYDASVTVGQFIRQGDPLRALTRTHSLNNHVAFSVVESVVWRLGGRSEIAQRLLPAACAAITVGLVAHWSARRHGTLAGTAAGLVAMAVPFNVETARDVRGYSLVTMCLTLAAMLIAGDLVVHGGHDGRVGPMARWDRRRILVSVAIAIAIGTHLFAGIGVLGLIVWAMVTDRGAWTCWSRSWIVGVVVGVGIHAPTLLDVADVARHRPGPIDLGFPVDTLRELLGRSLVAVTIIGIAVLTAATLPRRRPGRWAALSAAAAIAVPCSIMWLVMHPLDLYPRFFGWLAPLVAIAVGSVVGRCPAMMIPIGMAIVAMGACLVPSWSQDPLPNREIARYLADHPIDGAVCAVSYWGEPLMGYGVTTNALSDPDRAVRCGALVGPDSEWDSPVAISARGRLTQRVNFDSAGGTWFVLH